MAQKRPHQEAAQPIPEVFQSTRIDHETSSFIGCFSPILSAAALQRLPEFRTATHRIAAWRKISRQKSLSPSNHLFDTGHDDDGESWAGTRLARVLNDTQAIGTVVVARWYGGQNIGPVRFTHIETCAKEAIWKWRVAVGEMEKEGAAKKQKVDDEARRRELVEELVKRDQSILALRKLLAEKKAKLSGEEVVPVTPQKEMEYGKMGFDVLKRLDRARDATIGAVLKQMNKVDEDLRLLGGLDDKELDDLKEENSPKEDKLDEPSKAANMKMEGDKTDADNTNAKSGRVSKESDDMVVDATEDIQLVRANDWMRTVLEEFRQAIPDMTLEQRRQAFQAKEKQMRQEHKKQRGEPAKDGNEAGKTECDGEDSTNSIDEDIWKLRELLVPEDIPNDSEKDKMRVKELQQTIKEMGKTISDVQKEIKDTREHNEALLQRKVDAQLSLSEVQTIQIPSKKA